MPEFNDRRLDMEKVRADNAEHRAAPVEPNHIVGGISASTTNLGPTVRFNSKRGLSDTHAEVFIKNIHRTDPAQRTWQHTWRRGVYDISMDPPAGGAVSNKMARHLDALHAKHADPKTAWRG